jgi:acylglycerol lipase
MADRDGTFAGDRLFFRAWDAPAPVGTVVLAHGYAEHSGRYEHVGAAFADAGYTTWALDHAGHGQSEGERGSIGSIPSAVADLHAFVDLTAADGPVFLVGHSMGGLIAAAYAEDHQDRLTGLVLSGPALAVNEQLAALAELEEIPEISLAPLVSRDPAVVAAYENDPLNYLGPMPRSMLTTVFAEVEKVRARLGEITVPMLVMHGGADGLVPPVASEDVAKAVSSSDVTLDIRPGLYHEVFNEPEQVEVIATVVDWIRSRPPADR